MKTSLSILASFVSGLLLLLSFPPFTYSFCAWFALVPLMLACAGATLRRAALYGGLTGALFFLSTLHWLRNVTWAGTVALALYCALYFTPFALFVALRRNGWRSRQSGRNILWICGGAAVWSAAEYLRAVLLTGFPWNLLGVSQYKDLAFIQLAEWGGVYAVSALLVLMNGAVASTVLQYAAGLRRIGRMHVEMMFGVLAVALLWALGMHRLLERPEVPADRAVRAALIQPNIPEVGNWDRSDPEVVYDRLEKLTTYAQYAPGLDLIIWPETALPDFVRYSERSAVLVKKVTAAGAPLLAGSMDVAWPTPNRPVYYNASMLFDAQGDLLKTYYKQHLVLFGEYIPLDTRLDWLDALTPVYTSFTPGRVATLFKLPGDEQGFCVLICFEDSLPYLARRAARAGATWLVNQTNDSWFDPDCGSLQHLAQAVFRCVETRLPMLRSANTGISCAIDPYGRISQTMEPRTQGFQVTGIVPADPHRPATFYVRFGDLFAQTCLVVSIAVFLSFFFAGRRKRTPDGQDDFHA